MTRWDRPNVPHKGWVCIGMEDLGEFVDGGDIEYESCEMCGKERIRYVHIMSHNDGGILRVGCGCAAKMEEDYENPKQRDEEAKKKASRRTSFMKKIWRRNENGNYTLRYKGDTITIMKSKFGSTYGVIHKGTLIWDYKGRKNMDFNTSKRAAFDLFDSQHDVSRRSASFTDYEWRDD
jgi:hypothetical protein